MNWSFTAPYKAKVKLEILDRLKDVPNGKYIDVTAITPTPLAKARPQPPSASARRLAPTWARRSSPASASHPGADLWHQRRRGGRRLSQIIPMEDFNLHLTGDIHAITAANNLLAAAMDARMLHEIRRGR